MVQCWKSCPSHDRSPRFPQICFCNTCPFRWLCGCVTTSVHCTSSSHSKPFTRSIAVILFINLWFWCQKHSNRKHEHGLYLSVTIVMLSSTEAARFMTLSLFRNTSHVGIVGFQLNGSSPLGARQCLFSKIGTKLLRTVLRTTFACILWSRSCSCTQDETSRS